MLRNKCRSHFSVFDAGVDLYSLIFRGFSRCGVARVEATVDLTVWCGVGIVFVVAPGGCKPLILFGVCDCGVVASSPFLMVAVFCGCFGVCGCCL